MSGRYIVNIRDTSGTLLTTLDSWSQDGGGLQYTKLLDNIGGHSIALPFDDPRTAYFTKDSFLEVRRSDPGNGIAPYTDYVGFNRDAEKSVDQAGKRLSVFKGVDLNHLLKRRHILYYSGDVNTTWNTFADDAMKAIVETNLGDLATLGNGRFREGTWPAVAIEANAGLGPIWSGNRPYNNVFDIIHEIALATLVDFQFTLTSWSPLTFTFTTYYPYQGYDRTVSNGSRTPAVFSLLLNNMAVPKYNKTSRDEITAVIVLGQGQQSTRDYDVVEDDGTGPTDGHINDSPWNDIERTIDQREDGLVLSLTQAGYAELQHTSTKTDVTFETLNSSRLVYGRDYAVGTRWADLITVTFDDVDGPFDKRITGVAVQSAGPNETIKPTFSEIT